MKYFVWMICYFIDIIYTTSVTDSDIELSINEMNPLFNSNIILSDNKMNVFKFSCKNIINGNAARNRENKNFKLEKEYILMFLEFLSNHDTILSDNVDKIAKMVIDKTFLLIFTEDILFLNDLKNILEILFIKLIKYTRGKYLFNYLISNKSESKFRIWVAEQTINISIDESSISFIYRSLFILVSTFIFSSVSNADIINTFNTELVKNYLHLLLVSNINETLLLSAIYIYFFETKINISTLSYAKSYSHTLAYQLCIMKIKKKLSLTNTLLYINSMIKIKENTVKDITYFKYAIYMYIDNINLRIPMLNYIKMGENEFINYCIKCIFSRNTTLYETNVKYEILEHLNTKNIQRPILTFLNGYMYNIIHYIINSMNIDFNQITCQKKKNIISYVKSSFDIILEMIESPNLFKIIQCLMPENILNQKYIRTSYGVFITKKNSNTHQLNLPLKTLKISKNLYILDLKKIYISIMSYHLMTCQKDWLKLQKYENDYKLYDCVCKLKFLEILLWNEMKELSITHNYKLKYIDPNIIKRVINHTSESINYQRWFATARVYIANYIRDNYHLPYLKHLYINLPEYLLNEEYLKLYSENGETWILKSTRKKLRERCILNSKKLIHSF
ncbi:hypothetical protein TCON_1250 [Astathelohania contejeani]|uniref:Uncharacterized protein n=1 Tax=Astathelohania contejeani TaxID=164912 RepID=A0ABQ7HZB6_9MICR|nr:hypothetical protein TCON_1250 [Thelohania contejeani]